jgi:hypothetical protein
LSSGLVVGASSARVSASFVAGRNTVEYLNKTAWDDY